MCVWSFFFQSVVRIYLSCEIDFYSQNSSLQMQAWLILGRVYRYHIRSVPVIWVFVSFVERMVVLRCTSSVEVKDKYKKIKMQPVPSSPSIMYPVSGICPMR